MEEDDTCVETSNNNSDSPDPSDPSESSEVSEYSDPSESLRQSRQSKQSDCSDISMLTEQMNKLNLLNTKLQDKNNILENAVNSLFQEVHSLEHKIDNNKQVKEKKKIKQITEKGILARAKLEYYHVHKNDSFLVEYIQNTLNALQINSCRRPPMHLVKLATDKAFDIQNEYDRQKWIDLARAYFESKYK